MKYQINGLKDIHKLLMNERKIGGVIEVSSLRLRTGEEYQHAVITNIDLIGSSIYSIGFMTEDHQNVIVNINELALLNEPKHKKIYQLENQAYKTTKTKEKMNYLKRLFEVNKDSLNSIFLEEARLVIEDIGLPAAKKEVDTAIIYSKENLYSIA
ncbi:hypothetical protein FC682_17705 [Peribacillus simplex]|jgi:hypothetical protein|uniref:hypothetical protein n=1 Tax=Peribacillus TaxID=2675229 RepID=UPI0010BEB940|nr:hypothetical protein [Peribacillus simplex]TKH03496.1 hypothetical protein FC682_17705 [Peribacillus simplex]